MESAACSWGLCTALWRGCSGDMFARDRGEAFASCITRLDVLATVSNSCARLPYHMIATILLGLEPWKGSLQKYTRVDKESAVTRT